MLKIPDEYGILTENARRREQFAEYIERRVDAYFSSPVGQARIAREVDVRLKREVDELIARKTRERVAEIEKMERVSGPAIRDILDLVADVTGVSVPDLIGPRRARVFAWPRFLAVHLILRMRPDLSLPTIGRAMGNRDHTTIMHSREKFYKVCDLEPIAGWLANERVQELLAARPQVARAEVRPFGTLTSDQVAEIRNDARSQREISEAYGIARSHVHRIKAGQCWKEHG